MVEGRRFTQHFVADPSCCPSRAAMMTGRLPHNNGVRLQSQGPAFDHPHSMACYLRSSGYSTYLSGKFLTTWPKTATPPCFDHSTVIWEGYNNVASKVDGVSRTLTGYSTTALGVRGREYITSALGLGKPFLLYERRLPRTGKSQTRRHHHPPAVPSANYPPPSAYSPLRWKHPVTNRRTSNITQPGSAIHVLQPLRRSDG